VSTVVIIRGGASVSVTIMLSVSLTVARTRPWSTSVSFSLDHSLWLLRLLDRCWGRLTQLSLLLCLILLDNRLGFDSSQLLFNISWWRTFVFVFSTSRSGSVYEDGLLLFEIPNESFGFTISALLSLAPAEPSGDPFLLRPSALIIDDNTSTINLSAICALQSSYTLLSSIEFKDERSLCLSKLLTLEITFVIVLNKGVASGLASLLVDHDFHVSNAPESLEGLS